MLFLLDTETQFKIPKQCTMVWKTSTKRTLERNFDCIINDAVLEAIKNRCIITTTIISNQVFSMYFPINILSDIKLNLKIYFPNIYLLF